MRNPLSLLHVLNLDTIGGVESLYINFIQEIFKNRDQIPSHHHTIISGKRCHTQYKNIFDRFGYKPFHELYISGVKLPKCLRWIAEIRRGMIENVIEGPSRWVFWNKIEERQAPDDAVYYEHGASWTVEPNNSRRKFLKDMRKVIVNSKAAKTVVSHVWDIPFETISLVENPLRPDILIRNTHRQCPRQQLNIGFVGRLIPLKAPGIVLHVLSKLITHYKMEVTLHIAGEGSEKKFLQQLAQSLGIEEKVNFLDRVDNINTFYESIDFLIIPSVREPLGLVALEASAHGIPIIASRVDGLAESVCDKQSGILIPPSLPISENYRDFISNTSGLPRFTVDSIHQEIIEPQFIDPHTIAKTIHSIMTTPLLYEELSQGGIQHVLHKTSFKQYVEKILDEICGLPYVSGEEDQLEIEHEED